MRTLYSGSDMQRLEGDYELERGELVPMTPPGFEHGEVQLAVGSILRQYAKRTGRGRVCVESGIYTEKSPDSVRGPDVSYISNERLELAPDGFMTAAPDLVVEVVSPNDGSAQVEAKVHEYLAAGVRRVWIVYPRTKTVYVYRPGLEVSTLGVSDTLTDPEVLPDYSCQVAEFFE